tara:strand:+ start:2262 stop:2858 length:597 start_codon:yes stop_codon:yes gene_type:complete
MLLNENIKPDIIKKRALFILILISLIINIVASIILWITLKIHPWKLFTHYYIVGIVLVGVHALGHSKWGGWWRTQHVSHHHIKCYPYKKFLRKAPYLHKLAIHEDGNVWMFVIPALLGCWILSENSYQFFGLGIYSLLILLREDYLHQNIHTSPHHLEGHFLFETLRNIHKKHHQGNMKCNYGFGDPFHDLILGTLRY